MTAIAAIAMAQGLTTFRRVVMLVSLRVPVKRRDPRRAGGRRA
jgi:hypothetical protein